MPKARPEQSVSVFCPCCRRSFAFDVTEQDRPGTELPARCPYPGCKKPLMLIYSLDVRIGWFAVDSKRFEAAREVGLC